MLNTENLPNKKNLFCKYCLTISMDNVDTQQLLYVKIIKLMKSYIKVLQF